MNPRRRQILDENHNAELTPAEIAEGWHFCYDWDYLVVGPGTPEYDCCTCEKPIAWAHALRPDADVITDKVKKLWVKINPEKVEHYTIPLWKRPVMPPSGATQETPDPSP